VTGITVVTGVFPLEEFRILGPIGKGEFGKVHRASWEVGVGGPSQRTRDVALKHIEATQGAAKLQAEQDGVRLQELVWQQHRELSLFKLARHLQANADAWLQHRFRPPLQLTTFLSRLCAAAERLVRKAVRNRRTSA